MWQLEQEKPSLLNDWVVFGATCSDGSRLIGNAESGCAASQPRSTDRTTRPAPAACNRARADSTGAPSARSTSGASSRTWEPSGPVNATDPSASSAGSDSPDRTSKANDEPAERSLIR